MNDNDSLMAAAFEVAGIGVCFIGEDSTFLRVNPAFCRMLGYEQDELIGRPWHMAAPPDVAAEHGRFLGAVLKNSPKIPREWRIRRSDGSFLTALVSARAMDVGGGRRCAVVTFSNIDDRLRAEEEVRRLNHDLEQRIEERTRELTERLAQLESADNALRRSEERYRLVVDNVSIGIFVVRDAHFVFMNPRALDIIGYTAEEMDGAEFLHIVHPDERAVVMDRHIRRQRGEYVDPHYELQVMRKNGEVVWVALDAVLIQWDGRPATLSFAADITSRKAAEAALRSSEEQHRRVVENVSEGIIIVQDGVLCYANPSTCRISGYEAAELCASPFLTFVVEEDRAKVMDRYQRRLDGDTTAGDHYEFRIRRKDGEIIWLVISGVVIEWGGRPATLSFITDITERKAQDEALAKSEERYRHVVDNVSVGIIVVRDGRFAFINPQALAITGYTMETMIGSEFLPLVHPEDRAQVIDRHLRRQRGEQVESRYEFRVLHKDGSVVWVDLAAVAISWDGQPATLSFISDITRRKAVEDVVRRSEAHYRSVIDGAPVGIVIVRGNRICLANPAMLDMAGFTEQEMLALPSFLTCVDESDRAFMAETARGYVDQRSGDHMVLTFRVRRKTGELLWVEGSTVQVEWEGKQATLSFIHDITQQRRLEESLQQSLGERETILETSVVGIAFLNADGRVHWANKAMRELFGVMDVEITGRSLEAYYPSREEYLRVGAAVSVAVRAGRAFESELRMRRGDGSLFWANLSGKAVNSSDLSRGTIWTVLDVTQRRQAEEDTRRALAQQRELNELKSRFVSMTSHEFRTPLATILSSAELLRYYGDRLPVDEKTEVIGSIESAVKRMTLMLDGVLMIGRADAGKLEFQPGSVEPVALVRAVVEEAARAAASDGSGLKRLDFSSASTEDSGMLDEKLLRHIVGNLVGNAFKYSAEGTPVVVSLQCEAGEMRLSVADAGIGIPYEDQARLFETFHRASNVGNIQGTGLGLAIVKRAVDLHGGRISVESAAGIGTRFDVTLPLVVPKETKES